MEGAGSARTEAICTELDLAVFGLWRMTNQYDGMMSDAEMNDGHGI